MGLFDKLKKGLSSAEATRGAMVRAEGDSEPSSAVVVANETGGGGGGGEKRPAGSLLSALVNTMQEVTTKRPCVSARLDGPRRGGGKRSGVAAAAAATEPDAKAWHLRTRYGNRRVIPPASAAIVACILDVISKGSDTREAFVRVARFRSETDLLAFLVANGRMPEGDEHVEILNVSGVLPTTSSNVLLMISKFEYQGTSNPRFFPVVRVIGNSNTNARPIPCTLERLGYMLDATTSTVSALMRWYNVPEDSNIVPNYVLAQWSRAMLHMANPEYRMPTVPAEINERLNIISPQWDYAKIEDPYNKKDRLLPPIIQKKLSLLVEFNRDNRRAVNSNASFVRAGEKEDGQWNDFRSLANRGAVTRGGIREDDDEAKRDEMRRLLQLYEYLVIPLRAIAQGFCTAEFRARRRRADDAERELVFKVINSYILPMMNAEQARHIRKLRESEVDVGRRSRASFLEKTAALAYMSIDSLYRAVEIVQTQPWVMAISVIFRKMISLPMHMRWKEMTLPELARVMNMYNLEDLDPVVAAAIALYQHQLRDALQGFVAKDTFVPFAKISAHAEEMGKVAMVTAALKFLEDNGVVVIDRDENITRAARAYFGELQRRLDAARGAAARALIQRPRGFDDDDTRVYLANVYAQELGIVDRLGEVMARAAARPFRFLDGVARRSMYMQMTTGGITLDAGQQAAVDAVMTPRTPRDNIVHITGPPGTGKSAVICTIVLLAANKSEVMCTALSSAATDNVRRRMAGHPFNIRDDTVVCANLAQIGSGTDRRVSEASSRCRMLIIDEATMLDTRSFFNVLCNLPRLQTLVLVGDPNQLGAVGYGTPMEDMMRVFPVHTLTRMYRATGLLNHNATVLIEDPWNAVQKSEYALAGNVDELRAAHRFDPGPLYVSAGVTEEAFRRTGRRGAEFLRLQLANRDEAALALLRTSPCVYVPRDGNELTKENPSAATIEGLMDFLHKYHGATEQDVQVISAYNAPGLIISVAMQLFYRRETFDARDRALQMRLLRAALARRCSYEAGADGGGSLDGDDSGEYEAGGSGTDINPKHNRCPLMMLPGDTVVFTHNQTTSSGLSERQVFNGDRYKIRYIVDVGKTRGDPFGRDKNAEGGPSMKMTYYPPDIHHIEANAKTACYDATLRHSYVPDTKDLVGVGRFLYFTNGKRIYFGDFKRDSLLLGYCLTTHRFQGGQARYVIYVITKDDIEGQLSSRRTDLVAKTRVTERMFIVGTPSEAEKIVRRNPVMGYSAFMFRLEILMDKDYPKILEAHAAQAKHDEETRALREKALEEMRDLVDDGAFDDDDEGDGGGDGRSKIIAEAMEGITDEFFD